METSTVKFRLGSDPECLLQTKTGNLIRTFFGIFVDTPDQKKTYKRLNKMFKILYQSPVLVNPGNQREYFIVIWLNEKP